MTVYQFDDRVTTASMFRGNVVPVAAGRIIDVLVVMGVAVFWGLLLYAAISLAPL